MPSLSSLGQESPSLSIASMTLRGGIRLTVKASRAFVRNVSTNDGSRRSIQTYMDGLRAFPVSENVVESEYRCSKVRIRG